MDFDGPVPGIPGATIRRVAALPDSLPGGRAIDANVWIAPDQVLLVFPGVGRFLAREGKIIEYAPNSDADPGSVLLLLNGSARGALIHQRGELPLHAATLTPPGADRALAICGPSGAGKSTLAAELSRRGWVLLADDTTRITTDEAGALAWPSRDRIKLWRDACERAGIDISSLDKVSAHLDKYYVRVPGRDRPVILSAVIELKLDGPATPLSLGEAMALITRNTFRSSYILPLGRQADHVRMASKLAASCRILNLQGGSTRAVAELADAVENLLD